MQHEISSLWVHQHTALRGNDNYYRNLMRAVTAAHRTPSVVKPVTICNSDQVNLEMDVTEHFLSVIQS